MSIWGKIIGGSAGFALGGPIGALLGIAAGHGIDKTKIKESHNFSNTIKNEELEQVFATGVIALAAKLSKIDGKVTKDEIATFKRIFEFPNKDINVIAKLFNSAKDDAYDYESYALQLRRHFSEEKILHEILNALFAIACADKILHKNEEKMLIDISKIFFINQIEYNRIKSIYKFELNTTDKDKLERYYDLLGVTKNDSLETIKKKYREIIQSYHPDKIQGKGLPKDFVDFANKKLTDFNTAYNEIKKNKK